ncbi:hypothetical protein [Phenylobacterium sp.]|uniref:hypothetical protein n=1 Tax=Phenylobacterium sp. TaxID=1871053 RepID=UPI002CB33881|nr:hypothetical protein [Phenylobacterium sp.]HVI32223.1 hypothetical protein [Phenylobacterium sp.]
MNRRAAPLIAALVATGAAALAAPAAAEIKPGQQEGLGLTAQDVPELLKKAKADPYAPPAAPACETAYQELAALDQILGPDADEPSVKKAQAGNLLMKGVRSLIPHREIFRVLTGVDRKERELAEAAMAGWARRGYLKGMLRSDCEGDAAQTIAAAEPQGAPASAVEAAPAEQIALQAPAEAPAAFATEPPPSPPLSSGLETIAAADGLVNP